MSNPNVTLAEPIKALAEHQATASGFSTVDAYVASLIELNEDALSDDEIDALVQEGIDSGPSIPWTAELMSSILENARRTSARK